MSLKMFKESKPPSKPEIKKILAVAAGKGGVGKSTVTVNLARALKKQGYSVGILDTDIYGPSVRKMLPEDRMPSQKGEMIVPALCEGMPMISMAYFRNEKEASVVRAPIANGIVTQFLTQVLWGDLDYLLVDFPPGTGDVQLTLSQRGNLTGALMVTTPQEVAMMDVRKAMNMFNQVSVPLLGIVENMSGFFHEGTQETLYLFGKGGGEKLAREFGLPLLGAIPIDPELSRSGDLGKSIFSVNEQGKESPSVSAFLSLAEQVDAHLDLLMKKDQGALGSFELVWEERRS